MRIFYDTEFLEAGRTIDLISIGMVREDGRELYAINRDMPLHAIAKHSWLMANVVPHLPLVRHESGNLNWDDRHPDWGMVMPRDGVRDAVRRFVAGTADPQLWAWYGAYDHVALCQLFGRMIDLPPGIPMWTNDLRQEVARLGNPRLPVQAHDVEHNALGDARWVNAAYELLPSLVTRG